jgi:hypothetical protein
MKGKFSKENRVTILQKSTRLLQPYQNDDHVKKKYGVMPSLKEVTLHFITSACLSTEKFSIRESSSCNGYHRNWKIESKPELHRDALSMDTITRCIFEMHSIRKGDIKIVLDQVIKAL